MNKKYANGCINRNVVNKENLKALFNFVLTLKKSELHVPTLYMLLSVFDKVYK